MYRESEAMGETGRRDTGVSAEALALVDPNRLPPQMRQLVKIIGLANTLLLLQARGGTFLRVPEAVEHACVLREILPAGAVAKLVAALPGRRLELPKADKVMLQIRNRILRDARQWHSASTLALDFHLTRRQIINVTRGVRDYGQVDLFGEDDE